MAYPVGSVAPVVIVTPDFTVNEKVAEAVFETESVTLIVKVEVAAALGVPENTPAADRPSHEGNEEPLATVHV